jgi:hypothetical protein
VVSRGVRPRRSSRARSARAAPPALTLLCFAALLVSGCGGGAKQDAREPAGNFSLDVLQASFPRHQAIARPATLELKVRNSGTQAAPNVAVTVNSFEYAEQFPELAADKRPIWIVDAGPGDTHHPAQTAAVSPVGGGQTAYVDTWALGRLAPGATQTFRWLVAPVKSGVHTVTYTVAAGLAGKARAVNANGDPVQGALTADIASSPPLTHVNPNTGQVVAGTYPSSSAAP